MANDPTPTLTAEQRAQLKAALDREWPMPTLMDGVAAVVARMVADAEQRGRELGSRAEAALWRQQIEDRDRSGIMALDRQLAEEEGYERGRVEVSVAVEAVCRGLERPLNGARQRATSGEDFAAIRGEEASARSHAQQVRAALADPAAVARIKAEAGCELQRSGDGTHGPLIRQAKAEALREAADGDLGCLCGHDLAWHHEERGCQYHGNGPHRCRCLRDAPTAVGDRLRDHADRIGGDA